MVYPALLPLMHTPRLPVVDWSDASSRLKRTHPFRQKTKYGFCAFAITFQLASRMCWIVTFSWCNIPTWFPTASLLRFVDHSQTHTHTHTHTYSRYDSSGRVISPSQKPLFRRHTTNTRDEYSCPQPDSIPGSQASSGCTPTPRTHGHRDRQLYYLVGAKYVEGGVC